MLESARQLLQIMATNRRRYAEWEKLRIDRIGKLVPAETDVHELVTFVVHHEWAKYTKKRDESGDLIPAIKLRYEKYQALTS